jgi:hypothetical protein
MFTELIGKRLSGRLYPDPRQKRKRPTKKEGIAFVKGAEVVVHLPSFAPCIEMPFLVSLSWFKGSGV